MSDSTPKKQSSRLLRILVAYFTPLLIIVVSVGAAVVFMKTKPKSQLKIPEVQATLVAVQSVVRSDDRVVISVMGTVKPSREVTLVPQVSGRVIEIDPEFTVGGIFKADQEMLRIDSADYKIVVQQKESAVVSCKADLKIEQGYQEIAAREWELLDMVKDATELDIELALRKPYLATKKASLAAAQADLKKAELDVERTRVSAPFNSVVLSKSIDLGTEVSTQTQLATLAGTDTYWIQVSVPTDRLKWIDIPKRNGRLGSKAIIYGGETPGQNFWVGHVIRLLGDLETEGRMAKVLVEVPDPLGVLSSDDNKMPLLLGSYMNVDIEGREVKDVFSLPRSSLREDHSVWVIDNDQKLAIREVEIVWRDREKVLISEGLNEGDQVVVSDISVPVTGMLLKVDTDNQNAANIDDASMSD